MATKKDESTEPQVEKVTDDVGGTTVETTRVEEPTANVLKEDSPTTDAGQVHPATGNPAAVTQEGRDIRDDSQHLQALLTILGRSEAPLSDIQEQKLKGHPEIKKMVDGSAPDRDKLIKAMKEATTDQQRRAIIDQATAYISLRESVALLREPEDPHADPHRDRGVVEVRTD